MKVHFSLLLFLFTIMSAVAQDITGNWYGILKVPGQQLDLVFHISKTGDGYTSTMDSPEQQAFGIPVQSTTFKENVLELKIPKSGIQYEGSFQNSVITGTFKQGGMEFPLDLFREKPEGNSEVAGFNRPQEPKRPFPYVEEEVSFENKKDSVHLVGTLTLPEKEGKFPAVVLISGSGPQDRNSEVLGHKPFLVLADYLTRHGIAVLRYDERGVEQSTGNFSTATTADFANDTRAAVDFLRNREEINSEEIGLIGHSEGGMIAPMVAAKNKDIAFLVLMAGPGLKGDKLLLIQQELVSGVRGETEKNIQIIRELNESAFDILNSSSPENVENDLREFFREGLKEDSITNIPEGMDQQELINVQVQRLMRPWMQFFLTYDPAEALKKVEVPVLAINGDKDLQVSSEENLSAIEKALKEGGNNQVTIKEYPGLNHLFQESTTGSPDEYAEIEQTISPKVLKDIKDWVLEITQKGE